MAHGTARSIWVRPERAGRGPVPEHSRTQIAAAAVAIADEGGLDAVSMRRVAARIGAGAASLYRYVENRDEILELMADAVTGEIDLSRPPTGDWRADLVALAHGIRAVYRRHPWLLDVTPGRPGLGPRAVDVLEHALAALAELDAPAGAKLEAFALLNGFVALAVRTELAVGPTAAWQEAQAEFLASVVSAGRHPHLAAAFAGGGPPQGGGTDDLVDRVLPRLLAGVLDA